MNAFASLRVVSDLYRAPMPPSARNRAALKTSAFPLLALLLGLVVAGCDVTGSEPDREFDEDREFLPAAVITSMSPQGSAFAGVDEVVIQGSNFASDPSENFVYFGAVPGRIVSSTPTEIRVIPPQTLQVIDPDSVQVNLGVKVSVLGAELFSNVASYTLLDPAPLAFKLANVPAINSLAVSSDGTLHFNLTPGGVSLGINEIGPEGKAVQVIDDRQLWEDLEFGPGDALYGVRNIRALFKAELGGRFGTSGVVSDRSAQLSAIDVQDDATVWAGGDNSAIYKIDAALQVTAFPFVADVIDLQVVGGSLKVLAIVEEAPGIYDFPITGGELGVGTLETDLSSLPLASVKAFAWATSGEAFIAGEGPNPVYVLSPSGALEPLFPDGVISSSIDDLVWGDSPTLYALQTYSVLNTDGDPRRANAVIAINTRDRTGV